MTTLAAIFAKPADRPFNSVINIDDQNNLKAEFEEYVITRELKGSLETFLDNYGDYQENCAVWISGFYGSGKSHLLKMLALLLENQPLPGTTKVPLAYFLEKARDFHDRSFEAKLKKLESIPSESIFFNLKAKSSAADPEPILGPFLRVFNDHCGYYGARSFVASFERDLDRQGKLQSFKTKYQELFSENWEQVRTASDFYADHIDTALSAVTGQNIKDIVKRYREDEKLQNFNIDDFCNQVSDYIEQKNQTSPGFRLNFFADEAGQFVTGHNDRLLSLQTLAECLKKRCKGQAWLLVTAQEELPSLTRKRRKPGRGDAADAASADTANKASIDASSKASVEASVEASSENSVETSNEAATDVSRIQDRFGIRIHLGSSSVEEVLQKRLLTKNEEHLRELQQLYSKQQANFRTLFDFAQGPESSRTYSGFKDEEHFIASYPFVPFQYALYQDCIRSLAENHALKGRSRSRGERSLLGDFRDVLIRLKDRSLGALAGFDLLCDSLSEQISTGAKKQFQAARQAQGIDEFALRVLKVLFLVKFNSAFFTASARNLQILLYDDFSIKLNELRDQVHHALNQLVELKFAKKNAESYSFLTLEEREVENQIQSLHCDHAEIREELEKLFFSPEIVKTRYTDPRSKVSYTYMRWIDGRSSSKTTELGIALYTFLSRISENELLSSSDSGRDRCHVCVLLPEDRGDLYSELTLYLKTGKYLQSHNPLRAPEPEASLFRHLNSSNESRYLNLKRDFYDLIGEALILVKGHPVTAGTSAASRITTAFSRLVDSIYPRRLAVCFDENTLKQYLTPGFINPEAEPDANETTLLSRLVALRESPESSGASSAPGTPGASRTSVNPRHTVSLKELCACMLRSPYGWKETATACLTAALLAKNQIRLRLEDGRALSFADAKAAGEFLCSPRKWAELIPEPVSMISPQQVNRLRELYQALTDHTLATSDFERAVESLQELFRGALYELEKLLTALPELPCKQQAQNLCLSLKELAEKSRDFYAGEVNCHTAEIRELWLQREFLSLASNNGNFKILMQAQSLVKTVESSCPELHATAAQLQSVLQNTGCYAGPRFRQLKKLLEQLKKDFASQLSAARAEAQEEISLRLAALASVLKNPGRGPGAEGAKYAGAEGGEAGEGGEEGEEVGGVETLSESTADAEKILAKLQQEKLAQLEAADNPATVSLIREHFARKEYPALAAKLDRHPRTQPPRQVVPFALAFLEAWQKSGIKLRSKDELDKFTQNLHQALQRLMDEDKDILL